MNTQGALVSKKKSWFTLSRRARILLLIGSALIVTVGATWLTSVLTKNKDNSEDLSLSGATTSSQPPVPPPQNKPGDDSDFGMNSTTSTSSPSTVDFPPTDDGGEYTAPPSDGDSQPPPNESGHQPPPNNAEYLAFASTEELYAAVDIFLSEDPNISQIQALYGYEMSQWNVSLLTNFSRVFSTQRNPSNQWLGSEDFSGWDVSNAVTLEGMFEGANGFQGYGLAMWNVGSVISLENTFWKTEQLSADLSLWDVSNVRNMHSTFAGATAFSSDLSQWDVSTVQNMSYMFAETMVFDSDLSAWDVSQVNDMRGMFSQATAFQGGNLSSWNVANVQHMEWMFYAASSFDGDISSWDVSNVVSMENMFRFAVAFNQDLSGWNVSSATNMHRMFRSATQFNQNLCSWGSALQYETNVNVFRMFYGTACPNTTDPNLALPVPGPFCFPCE